MEEVVFLHTGRTEELKGGRKVHIYFQTSAGIVRLMQLLTLKIIFIVLLV